MKNQKKQIWTITAGIIFGLSVVATIGLMVMVGMLDMLPIGYMVALVFAMIFVYAVSFFCNFMLPFSKKKKGKKFRSKKAPEEKNKSKYVFRAIGMLLAVVLMIVDAIGIGMISKLQSTLNGVMGNNSVLGTEDEVDPGFDITKDPFIVYISGNDTESNMDKVRSDVNILAVVNPTTKQVLLLNTPRDYYVDISVAPGQKDKLTHCGNYGIECSMDTLSALYGVEVNYFAQVSFNGFIGLIDAIGGISVYSEKEFVSWSNKIHFDKGTNYVDGAAALEFVRERKAFGDGDAARGRHQMEVIKGVAKKMLSGALLTSYGDILDSLGGCFRTNVTQNDMTSLVKAQLKDMGEWNIQSFSVKGKGTRAYTYSIPNSKTYVTVPDDDIVEYAGILVERVFEGTPLTEDDLDYSQEKLAAAKGELESTESVESTELQQ